MYKCVGITYLLSYTAYLLSEIFEYLGSYRYTLNT